jgi:hypothetical protein
VTSNASANKIDVFLHRSITYQARFDPGTGAVRASTEIRLSNLAPAAGLPAYVIGGPDTQLGENRLYLSFYTPLSLERATVDGVGVTMDGQRELGRNVFSTFLTVGPGAEKTIRLELAGTLPAHRPYVLDVAAQPTVNPDELHAQVALVGKGEVRRRDRFGRARSDAELTTALISDRTLILAP